MEKFAVDLDAVLDEFELNEDQAEVAAARLQKQIEQGRLEIASSDTTPGSSYANSPRSSFAHLHEDSSRTVSPLARPSVGAESVVGAAAALRVTNHRLPVDPTANHRPPADPAANCRLPDDSASNHTLPVDSATNHTLPVDSATNHIHRPTQPTNYHNAPAYPSASDKAAIAPAALVSDSSSSASDPSSPEHLAEGPGSVPAGARKPAPPPAPDAVPSPSPVAAGCGPDDPATPNGEDFHPRGPAADGAAPVKLYGENQNGAEHCSETAGSGQQSAKGPGASGHLPTYPNAQTLPGESLKSQPIPAHESTLETAGQQSPVAAEMSPGPPAPAAAPTEALTVIPAAATVSTTAPIPAAAPANPGAVPPEVPAEVPGGALQAALIPAAAASVAPAAANPGVPAAVSAGAAEAAAAPTAAVAAAAPVAATIADSAPVVTPSATDQQSCRPPATVHPERADAGEREGAAPPPPPPADTPPSPAASPDGAAARVEVSGVQSVQQTATGELLRPAEAAAVSDPGLAAGSIAPAAAGPPAADAPSLSAGVSSLLSQVARAPSPPTVTPTGTAENGRVGALPAAPAAAGIPATGAAESAPVPEPEPVREPVRFQPADDVSDSELETYLQQLEEDPAAATSEPAAAADCGGAATSAETADESFGGARPKTTPVTPVIAAVATTDPSQPSAAQPLKGGVISRLQSQVSIECEVDSRSTRSAEVGCVSPPPPPAPPVPAPAPPPPVRPSSLDLPSRSHSIAEQDESAPAEDVASEPAAEPASDPVGAPPPPLPPPPAAAPVDDDAPPAQESVSTTGGNIVTAPGAYEEARLAAGRTPAVPVAAAPAAAPTRGQLVSLSDEDKNLGKVAPVWVPDEDAVACMECELKFTVIRRRHHCRACGRLLCSACCSERMCLDYMEFREGRVCTRCKRTIDRVQQESRVVAAGRAAVASHHHMARPPNPNNPMEYCSTVPPTQQATPNAPPPTVMVPSGVLKRSENSGGRTPSREAKQVMFSDGIRPGGDLTEPAAGGRGGPRAAGAETELRRPPHRRTARLARGSDRSPAAILKDAKGCKDLSWKPDSGKLPPIYQSGSAGSSVKQSTPEETIVSMIRAERELPWSFLINKNLMVVVKLFKLDCCVGRTCWIFTSHGLSTVGQEEVVIILESLPDEATLPKDIFFFYHHLFSEASKGHFVTELGHSLFSVALLGSKEHGGFLYLRPTFQCLHNVPVPPQPFLVAVLIQKWEAPWAKVFPLRLLLRLGAEFRYYPCPLVSVRHRKPVFFEVGHTIINLLADFRNFAYVLPTVHGMHIHMEEQQTSVLIPRNRFNQVLKAINDSNDHVLALGASFSREADSHLVCMQNEDGQYQTQAINIQNRPRQVTGASFIVFNGALKSTSGVTAKSSIVEDGLMFQISSDTMQALRASLRQMQDYKIQCGPVGEPPDEVINIKWVEDDRSHNLGVRSVIDDKPLDGVPSIRVHSGTDYVGDSKLIRWTEVYLIKVTESVARSSSEPPDFSQLAEEVARGTCVALTPHLPLLAESERTRIGLRATVDRDTVGYEAGSNGEALPPSCMNLLDSELVPVLHRYAAEVPDSPICLELLFHVIDR